MAFSKIVTRVVVDEKDKQMVTKQIQSCLDALVDRRVLVFDSGLTIFVVCEVEGYDEIRREMAV